MFVKAITSRSRRDINITLECESCKATKETTGYDDTYYHSTVVPKFACTKCGKVAPASFVPMEPMYPKGFVI